MPTSRPFNWTTDSFSENADEFRSTYFAARLDQLLRNHPSGTHLDVGLTTVNDDDIYSLTIQGGGGTAKRTLVADLPCPDQCLPPARNITPDSFEKDHVESIVDLEGCVAVVIHKSFINGGGIPRETASIYGVDVDSNGELRALNGRNDTIFICDNT